MGTGRPPGASRAVDVCTHSGALGLPEKRPRRRPGTRRAQRLLVNLLERTCGIHVHDVVLPMVAPSRPARPLRSCRTPPATAHQLADRAPAFFHLHRVPVVCVDGEGGAPSFRRLCHRGPPERPPLRAWANQLPIPLASHQSCGRSFRRGLPYSQIYSGLGVGPGRGNPSRASKVRQLPHRADVQHPALRAALQSSSGVIWHLALQRGATSTPKPC